MPLPRAEALCDWLIDLTKETALEAKRALRRPSAGQVVARGAYGTPTVAADKRAEKVIIDAMRSAPIPLHLFSEEVGWVRHPDAEWTLIADPIDGTRNAVRGLPFWCVSLAVAKSGLRDLQLGVVRDGLGDEVYHARKGEGAHLDGRRLRVRPLNPKEVIVAAALDYERTLRIKWHPNVHFRDLGSSALELCLVAAGGIDIFLSTKSYLRIVDIAGATLVLREAGGHVLDLRRKRLNANLDLRERISMMALGDRRAWRVLQ